MLLNTIKGNCLYCKSTQMSYSMFHGIRTLIRKKDSQRLYNVIWRKADVQSLAAIQWRVTRHYSHHQDKDISPPTIPSHKTSAESFVKSKDREEKPEKEAAQKLPHGKNVRDLAKDGSSNAWEDTFGNLAINSRREPVYNSTHLHDKVDQLEDEEFEDDEDRRPLKVFYRKLPVGWYTKQMEKFAKEGKIDKAIDVLEVIMLQKDRIRPLPTHYYTLISLISKTGDTKKAFGYFKKMRDFGYEPIPPVFTALFNACSRSIYGSQDGFLRATKLIHTMKSKNITPNQITFNAMIKTFGMLGKTEIALHLADQNLKLYKPDDKAFANILMAASGDERNGFSLAIGVWRLASICQVKPTVYHYMLLLRAIRCCDIGDMDSFYQLLLQTSPFAMQELLSRDIREHFEKKKDKNASLTANSVPQLHPPCQGGSNRELENKSLSSSDNTQPEHDIECVLSSTNTSPGDMLDSRTKTRELAVHPDTVNPSVRGFPDVLKPGEILLGVLNIHKLKSKYARLGLLGGSRGFLARMERDGLTPNLAVFGQLFDIIDTLEEEDFLFSLMEKLNITPDIDIITHAMLKRLRRLQMTQAKELVDLMQKKRIQPNIFIFKYLNFIECRDGNTMRQFLDELQANDLALNVFLMNGLMNNTHVSLVDKKYLLEMMEELDIHPTHYFLETVHKILKTKRTEINIQKRTEVRSEKEEEFSNFNKFFIEWLKRVPMQT